MRGTSRGLQEGNKEGLGGGLEGGLEGRFGGGLQRRLQRGLKTGLGWGLDVKLRSRSGLVKVWFSLQLKFNSLELDSEVGQLLWSSTTHCINLKPCPIDWSTQFR